MLQRVNLAHVSDGSKLSEIYELIKSYKLTKIKTPEQCDIHFEFNPDIPSVDDNDYLNGYNNFEKNAFIAPLKKLDSDTY